ncbi:menaquinol oxidoreductase complex ACIII, molybdopterin-binding-like and iron-sulfur cluster-binding subunit ActB [Geotalea daltonii FRC-32]|uniref:Menaquinol oxidoreductase complex ACIII, molybdopterin-binding-like and iron-sulfur cluster-binding subunit ActB n=1 Tax=Geotalea daltonii (strain DSM 22248 / JCM 15807 / FRC-32) TaxID=316067 RepID=B9M1T1_GEODF|nr:4Fe-4S dicluster domain-containing protein [Geotalea daltonii]ACM19227.1 menaquinol oxidoreductase complex ACIII, molybdopterin-binding-like and iron-sulfur cluster-binding subunit ActB [Geotalea daltonii FRC-32]
MPKMTRRNFLWLTGGTGVALAVDPPRKLVNKLIPQVIPPENIKPGEWAFFATTCRECPAGCGMHLWHRDGRITKAEGNPDHPVNRGGLCPRGQSALQGLYDPDRLQKISFRPQRSGNEAVGWHDAIAAIGSRLKAGGRVALMSSLQTGSLAEVMKHFAAAFGSDRLLFYEAFSYEPLKAAHGEVFGLPLVPRYQIQECELIVSFAADFLESWISPVSFASQFGEMHGYRNNRVMNRMVYIGPRLSMTAANADEFMQVPPGAERLVALKMLRIILEKDLGKNNLSSISRTIERLVAEAPELPGVEDARLVDLCRTFCSARSSVALAAPVGSTGPMATETAIVAALLNYAAGRIGQTVDFSRHHALSDVAGDGQVRRFLASLGPDDTLFIHDTNPLFSRGDAALPISRAGMIVYLGTLENETAAASDWILPIDCPLETWGDYEPEQGIRGLMQPTMPRLYDTRAVGDIFLTLAQAAGRPLAKREGGAPVASFREWLTLRWQELHHKISPAQPFENFWKSALSRGGVWSRKEPAPNAQFSATAVGRLSPEAKQPRAEAGEVQVWPWGSIMLFDGRTANRGWIQEAPDPVTFIAWGNWIDINGRTAADLEIQDGEMAELKTGTGAIRAPVRITDEVAGQTAAIAFGQGHTAMGRIAGGIGANPFLLLGAGERDVSFARGTLRKVGGKRVNDPTYTTLTRQQWHRELVQWIPLSQVSRMEPGDGEELIMPLPEGYKPERDLYPKREYLTHRWAMVIDLQRCIGCGACAVACYAENNIAVIGKGKVGEGREMAWLRVAPYHKPGATRRLGWLPLLCQHCDAAPCEPVCPVFAAMHNEEGLNAQIYNRCIGTRYCSNNCPYKVRRFNWVNINWRKPLDMQLNPEVTVRSRGVMEKCTFCVQRIRNAEAHAARENRKILDGEIQPACAQSCPTRVYTFGDLLDPASEVSRLTREDPRRYHLLEELNTKPAVTFLRRVDGDW